MTRIVFAADVHVGNHRRMGGAWDRGLNKRARLCVEVLARARKRAEELGAAAFVVLGDVFDDDRPGPQLVAAVQRALRPVGRMAVIVVKGNHDATSDEPGHNALAPLAPAVTVIAEAPRVEEIEGVEIGLVPFSVGSAPEILRAAVAGLKWCPLGVPRILGIHFGVKTARTPPWLRDAPDAMHVEELGFLAAKHEIGDVFAGHWHHRETRTAQGEASVWQIGSLCPSGFDDTSEGHGIAVWEDGAVRFEEIEGPRFLEAKTEDEIAKAVGGDVRHSFFVSWSVPPAKVAESIERLEGYGAHRISAFEVVPDGEVLAVAAKDAADAARSATAFDEALEGFVANMAIPEGVDRAKVLDLARGYIERTRA
jgi:DNA repair exonuclease SbcCD nuclease subunit